MILPGKHLKPDRALLTVGADLLNLLSLPLGVSETWERYRRVRSEQGQPEISFDWFCLAATLLFSIGAVDLDEAGRLKRGDHDPHAAE